MVGMLRITIDGIRFTFMVGNDATHHFFQFITKRLLDEISPSLDRENELDVHFCICICHSMMSGQARLFLDTNFVLQRFSTKDFNRPTNKFDDKIKGRSPVILVEKVTRRRKRGALALKSFASCHPANNLV